MKVLVVHPDFDANGGAEAYARAIIDVLQARGHAVGRFDIHGHMMADGAHDDVGILRAGRGAILSRVTLWKYALVCRALPKIARGYDRVILSFGEGPNVGIRTLRLLHAPALFSPDAGHLRILGARHPGLRQIYTRICRPVARVRGGDANADVSLANSKWTAAHAQAYFGGAAPMVLYPEVVAPKTLPEIERVPFRMIALGRIVRNKRLEETVALLDQLRARGIAAELTIIGRANTRYGREFVRQYRDHPHLVVRPDADGHDVATALAKANIGIHPYRGEHFGIAVAEMICAGVIPLVHDSGGVCELVLDERLRFADAADLAEKAGVVMVMNGEMRGEMLRDLRASGALQQAQNFTPLLTDILHSEMGL